MRLGINASGPNYYQSDAKFSDLMTARTPFFASPPTPAPTMSGGYPVALAPGQSGGWIAAAEGYLAPGSYTLAASGTGTVRILSHDVPQAARDFSFAGATGQSFPLPLSTAARMQVAIVQTDPTDPLNSIQILSPGAVPGSLWNPAYLASLAGFDAIRFMDWQATNSSMVARWSDAPTAPGWSVADMVDLCNRLNAHPWFCIPHMAATPAGLTDYASQLGALVGQRLNPGLKCYVEFSNEVWNWIFTQTQKVNTWGSTASPPVSMRAMYGTLAAQAFAAVRSQVPAGGPKVVGVLAGQFANAQMIAQSIAAAPPGSYQAVACAPYCQCLASPIDLATLWAGKDAAGAIALLVRGLYDGMANLAANLAAWARLADAAGVEMLCYEMGPALQSQAGTPGLTALVAAAWNDPRMAQWHHDYLAALNPYFALANYYAHCRQDCWGAIQTLGDTDSQRWAALRAYAARWNG